MKIIRTVLGDIPADQIGATDAHDHLIRSGGPEIKLDPAFLMDDVETAKKRIWTFPGCRWKNHGLHGSYRLRKKCF